MTGYGKCEQTHGNVNISVEVKSVNNRFFDLNQKLPRVLSSFEDHVSRIAKSHLIRGRVSVFADISYTSGTGSGLRINREKLGEYLTLATEVQQITGSSESLSLEYFMNIPDLTELDKGIRDDELKEFFLNTLIFALEDLKKVRKIEGENLGIDLISRLTNIKDIINRVEITCRNCNDKLLETYRNKIESMLHDCNIDENRIIQEAAILSEKKDVTEEIVRMRSHIKLFHAFFSEKESPGKRINFLLQEMLREVNTIGSKSTSIDVSHDVVLLKDELEKMREQAQNIL